MDFAVRSIFDPTVTFSIHDRRATLELWRYGCVIIAGAAASLTEASSVGKILRQSLGQNRFEGITKTGEIPIDYGLKCIKREFLLNEAVISLISRTPGSDSFVVGSYQPMAIFHHPEAESTHLWYKDINADVIGFETLHLGADAATFSIGVYATATPDNRDRNVKAVAYGGDVIVYRGRVPRTIPNLRELGEVGFAIKVSYLHLKNLSLSPLPLPIVQKYIEEGGDSVRISAEGHAILAHRDTYGPPELERANTVAPATGISSTDALIAMAERTVLRGQRLASADIELVDIINRANYGGLRLPADEMLLRNIIEAHRSKKLHCPVSGCPKHFFRRNDLVQHIRRPRIVFDLDVERRHTELDTKYQGMELICCGETKTSFGTLVKHIKKDHGTDPLDGIQLDQPGQHLLLDFKTYMSITVCGVDIEL